MVDRSPSGPKKAGGSIRWKARRAKSVSAVSKDRGLSAVSGQNCFETRKLSLLWALRTLPGQSGGDKEYISTRREEHVSCICDVRRHLINEILWILPESYIQKSEWRRRRVHFISTQTKHLSRIFNVIPSMESSQYHPTSCYM